MPPTGLLCPNRCSNRRTVERCPHRHPPGSSVRPAGRPRCALPVHRTGRPRRQAWLLDLCPPEYRTYPALRRHAVVLARFAVLHVEACQAAVNQGLSEARGGLREVADGLGRRGGGRDLAPRVGTPGRRTPGGRSGRGGTARPPLRRALVTLGGGTPKVGLHAPHRRRSPRRPPGHVLLQHRDEHAPRAANQWGMVGGHVEHGEDFDSPCTARSSRRPASRPGPTTWCCGRRRSSATPTGTAATTGCTPDGWT